MKVAIITNEKELSLSVAEMLKKQCQDNGLDIDENAPDIVVSIGGDGTMLSAFHRYEHLVTSVRFVAVHTGTLGFYTDFLANQIDQLVAILKKGNLKTNSYPILDIAISQNGEHANYKALNEMTVKTVTGTMVCEVAIDEHLFEVYRGDGLCVSTPTGSTGISKSLGGAILHPSLNAMQLVEIAPLNNRVYRTIGSPMILPSSNVVSLKVSRAITPFVTIDNLLPIFLDTTASPEISITVAKERVQFLDVSDIPFWNRVESAFIGDINREALNVSPSSRRYRITYKKESIN